MKKILFHVKVYNLFENYDMECRTFSWGRQAGEQRKETISDAPMDTVHPVKKAGLSTSPGISGERARRFVRHWPLHSQRMRPSRKIDRNFFAKFLIFIQKKY